MVSSDANEAANNFGYEICRSDPNSGGNPLYDSAMAQAGNKDGNLQNQRSNVDLNPLYEVSDHVSAANDETIWRAVGQSTSDLPSANVSNINHNPIYEDTQSDFQPTNVSLKPTNTTTGNEIGINPLYDQASSKNPLYECSHITDAQSHNDELYQAVQTETHHVTHAKSDEAYKGVTSLSHANEEPFYNILEKPKNVNGLSKH